MRLDEALDRLRHPSMGFVDLTGQRIQQIKNPKVKRALRPVLDKYFPRRRLRLEDSSYGRVLRARLLPLNPHFETAVEEVRLTLGIPQSGIGRIALSGTHARKAPWDSVSSMEADEAASWFLHMSRKASHGLPFDEDDPPLPQWLLNLARYGGTLPLDSAELPEWMRKLPQVPSFYSKAVELDLPIGRLAGRLIERFGLPWDSYYKIIFCILTGNRKYIDGIFPLDVTVACAEGRDPEAFSVTIESVDEFVTKAQWDEVWDRVIAPRQDWLWEQRGELRHSKRTETDRLEKPWVQELHRLIQREKIGVDEALDKLSHTMPALCCEVDRSTAYRVVKRLDSIIRPRD